MNHINSIDVKFKKKTGHSGTIFRGIPPGQWTFWIDSVSIQQVKSPGDLADYFWFWGQIHVESAQRVKRLREERRMERTGPIPSAISEQSGSISETIVFDLCMGTQRPPCILRPQLSIPNKVLDAECVCVCVSARVCVCDSFRVLVHLFVGSSIALHFNFSRYINSLSLSLSQGESLLFISLLMSLSSFFLLLPPPFRIYLSFRLLPVSIPDRKDGIPTDKSNPIFISFVLLGFFFLFRVVCCCSGAVWERHRCQTIIPEGFTSSLYDLRAAAEQFKCRCQQKHKHNHNGCGAAFIPFFFLLSFLLYHCYFFFSGHSDGSQFDERHSAGDSFNSNKRRRRRRRSSSSKSWRWPQLSSDGEQLEASLGAVASNRLDFLSANGWPWANHEPSFSVIIISILMRRRGGIK